MIVDDDVYKRFTAITTYIVRDETMNTFVGCNPTGTIFAEMSSQTALICNLDIKTAFYTKHINNKYCWILLCVFFVIFYENAY